MTKDSQILIDDIQLALEEMVPEGAQVEAAAFGIAGPVDEAQGVVPILIDIPQWGSVSEKEISERTGIKQVRLMNDFVANAYGVAALQDEKETFTIYEPPETERTADKVRLVFGVGTGLGVSILARPNETVPFQAYPSEGGVVRMPHYNKADREYLEFLKEKKYNETPATGLRDDVSMVLAGEAISWVTEFLAT